MSIRKAAHAFVLLIFQSQKTDDLEMIKYYQNTAHLNPYYIKFTQQEFDKENEKKVLHSSITILIST